MAEIAEFDAIIDVRTPAEFELDRVPGAINFPVLDDAERVEVGTTYRQVSAFEARKRGAALVARNIAKHLLSEYFASRPRDWHPLIYCWRGGKRSGAMTHVLREIGWSAAQLEGGYQSYRRHVVAGLGTLPGQLSYRVVCGETGSGKSRLLHALAAAGAQVLDLEQLARHRGSLLGDVPNERQPSQKAFETGIWHALGRFDPARPVFIEAESRKIGELRVPETLLTAMWASPCVRLELPLDQRVGLLKEEYAHFFADPDGLCEKLDRLTSLHGKAVIAEWKALARSAQWDRFVAQLLSKHYDPAYRRSTGKHYARLGEAAVVACSDRGESGMAHAAQDALRAADPAEIPA